MIKNTYQLEEFQNIIYNGFNFTIPDETIEKISNLAIQVGSNNVKQTVFNKNNETKIKNNLTSTDDKKRKNNKNNEIKKDEWELLRTFETTKKQQKLGIENDFDVIRSYINKLTDKNYIDMRNKIVEIIEKIITEKKTTADLYQIGANIFEIASSNKFYSKIYAELYADLSSKFDFIKTTYEENFNKFIGLFNNIEFAVSNENYDKFCEINKINDKRKSLALFYMNLMDLGVIHKDEIIQITKILLSKIYEFIYLDNKKNEVDELTETISILYKKEIYDNIVTIDGLTIYEIIVKIANSKVKDFKSLSNKSLFKFMDLIEM